ncbi:hypothetical protein D5018_20465 [Parashewanella curva]|uniref:YnfC family lipoprotein n=1 Tax=Parashewanella curva TaxID=2338552 RepID=A0A3L8PSM8_9GAMM|nr:hypothetical protein [Parashewanella curva]RLV57829.1 hypothetical protein D5018_20465 [Parashewanella curva]
MMKRVLLLMTLFSATAFAQSDEQIKSWDATYAQFDPYNQLELTRNQHNQLFDNQGNEYELVGKGCDKVKLFTVNDSQQELKSGVMSYQKITQCKLVRKGTDRPIHLQKESRLSSGQSPIFMTPKWDISKEGRFPDSKHVYYAKGRYILDAELTKYVYPSPAYTPFELSYLTGVAGNPQRHYVSVKQGCIEKVLVGMTDAFTYVNVKPNKDLSGVGQDNALAKYSTNYHNPVCIIADNESHIASYAQ